MSVGIARNTFYRLNRIAICLELWAITQQLSSWTSFASFGGLLSFFLAHYTRQEDSRGPARGHRGHARGRREDVAPYEPNNQQREMPCLDWVGCVKTFTSSPCYFCGRNHRYAYWLRHKCQISLSLSTWKPSGHDPFRVRTACVCASMQVSMCMCKCTSIGALEERVWMARSLLMLSSFVTTLTPWWTQSL